MDYYSRTSDKHTSPLDLLEETRVLVYFDAPKFNKEIKVEDRKGNFMTWVRLKNTDQSLENYLPRLEFEFLKKITPTVTLWWCVDHDISNLSELEKFTLFNFLSHCLPSQYWGIDLIGDDNRFRVDNLKLFKVISTVNIITLVELKTALIYSPDPDLTLSMTQQLNQLDSIYTYQFFSLTPPYNLEGDKKNSWLNSENESLFSLLLAMDIKKILTNLDLYEEPALRHLKEAGLIPNKFFKFRN